MRIKHRPKDDSEALFVYALSAIYCLMATLTAIHILGQ